MLPVLLAAYAVRGRLPAGQRTIARIAKILVSFAVAFVVSTPGAVIQPIRFLIDVREIFKHYRSEEHGNYTVSPGLGHGLGILEYMGMVVFSSLHGVRGFLLLFYDYWCLCRYKSIRLDRTHRDRFPDHQPGGHERLRG